MPDSDRNNLLMNFGTALPPLQRAYRAAADRAVAHFGLSQALAWPLVMLGRLAGPIRQGMLAEVLAIEAPSLVRSLDQLVEAGLAERRDDPLDGRARTLHLTAAGRAVCDQIEAALQELRNELFAGISDADLAASLRVFGQLGRRLGMSVPQVPVRAAKVRSQS
ncbi:MAG: MarR family transcriptional regulator [Steroidobacteraceae bacterium]